MSPIVRRLAASLRIGPNQKVRDLPDAILQVPQVIDAVKADRLRVHMTEAVKVSSSPPKSKK